MVGPTRAMIGNPNLDAGTALAGQNQAPAYAAVQQQPVVDNSFLSRVKFANTPNEKAAVIDGYVAGFQAGILGGTGNAAPPLANFGPTPWWMPTVAPNSGQVPGSLAEFNGLANPLALASGAQVDPAVKEGFSSVADALRNFTNLVAELPGLPEDVKNKLLGDVANTARDLRDSYPGNGLNSPLAGANPGILPANFIPGNSSASSMSSASSDQSQWTHSVADGKATIDLGNYKITAEENNESFTIEDKSTGEKTRVSGDPHVVTPDGKFDFHKDLNFKLPDGTNIAVHTVPAGDHGGQTYASQLVITKGDKALTLSGLAGDQDGANNLSIKEGAAPLPNANAPTLTLTNGHWVDPQGNQVNQGVIDRLERGNAGDPNRVVTQA